MTHVSDLVLIELMSGLLNLQLFVICFFEDIYSFLCIVDHGHLNTSSKVSD